MIVFVGFDGHRTVSHRVEHILLVSVGHHDLEFHDAVALGFIIEFGPDDLAARLGFDVCHDSRHFGVGAQELRQFFDVFCG